MSAIIGLAEEEGAEAFFSALETGLTPEEQKKDKSTMPGMSDNPFDKVYLVTPTGGDDALTERLTEKAKFHFDAELCATLAEAVELAHANPPRSAGLRQRSRRAGSRRPAGKQLSDTLP